MANRYANPIRVPDLRQKIWLLYQSNARINDDASFGRLFRSNDEPFGVSGKTVRNWMNGEKSREADMVPAERFDRFVEIFKKALPGSRSTEETRALLISRSAGALAEAFLSTGPAVDWISLALNATEGNVALVPARTAPFGVTARRRPLEELSGWVEFPVRREFRFSLAKSGPSWVTCVQWGRTGWFGIDVDDGNSCLDRTKQYGLVPSAPPYFSEDEPGMRRYLFLATPTPMPPDLLSRIALSARGPAALDVATLDRLAYLVGEMREFRMDALNVNFVDPNERDPIQPSHLRVSE